MSHRESRPGSANPFRILRGQAEPPSRRAGAYTGSRCLPATLLSFALGVLLLCGFPGVVGRRSAL